MKIKVWKYERTMMDMDVEFPLYSRWIGDHSDRFNRVDAGGLCISIIKNSGAEFEGPSYEIKQTKINFGRALDGSYIATGGAGEESRLCTEAEFLAVLDEMIAAIQKMRAAIPSHDN